MLEAKENKVQSSKVKVRSTSSIHWRFLCSALASATTHTGWLKAGHLCSVVCRYRVTGAAKGTLMPTPYCVQSLMHCLALFARAILECIFRIAIRNGKTSIAASYFRELFGWRRSEEHTSE